MAPQRHAPESPPPYSHCPSANDQVLAIAPDFPLADDAIRLVQERFPGTSAGDAWEFVQRLAILVRNDVHRRREERIGTSRGSTPRQTGENGLASVIPEDSPMPDAA